MRRIRIAMESLVVVAAILACTSVWSRLGADDKDQQKHKCPLCGNEDVKFENTPEGAFQKFRFAMATLDRALLKDAAIGMDDSAVGDMFRHAGHRSAMALMEVKSCKVEEDQATLLIALPDEKAQPRTARRQGGIWRMDTSLLVCSERVYDCTNNLRQLGTYIVMYVSKYGNDRNYSGPGRKLLTDLYNLPTPEKAICQDLGLLVCKEHGDKTSMGLVRKEDPACTSYECIDQKLADGVTQPSWPIAWDRKPHADGTRNVLFFSGSVKTMTEEEFQKSLKQWPGK